MRYVKIDKVNAGDILAKDIVDQRGNILLRATPGMILKENIIQRLKEKGINGLYINDELSKNVIIEESIPSSIRQLATQALEKKSVQDTQELATQIVDNFNSHVEIDLNRMMGEVTYYERALNICELSVSVGKYLKMSNESLKKLTASALLSDIALIMSEEEKERILDGELQNLKKILLQLPITETYPIIGRYAVSQAHADPMVIHSVYFHKENEDGTGLVQNLYKKLGIRHNCDIRDTAKIIHICSDYVDALIHENDLFAARNKIERGIFEQKYNYDLAFAFLRFIPIYPIGTVVELSNGEKAIVARNNDGNPFSPVIYLENGEEIDLMKTLNVVITGIHGLNNKAFQK